MEQEDLIKKDLTLSVQLPEGCEKTVTVHGSKPVMDVLVILCARYHLNPSDHVIELFSTNHNKLQFKPSSLIGSLEAELVVLKPKRSDVRKAPNKPEATVRLIINYRNSHKAVVRVSPRVPLAELMPTVCEKCEMDPKSTVLLRDGQSEKPLDLTKTLNDYGIRDVYAKAVSGSPNDAAALTQNSDCKKERGFGEKENTGLLGLFRRSKKSAEEPPTHTDTNIISATAAPLVLKDQQAINTPCSQASDMPKKRRAPQPPSGHGSQSVSTELNSEQQAMLPNTDNEKRAVLSRISSTESLLKGNKRKAPPPPGTSPSLPEPADKEDGETDNLTKASFNRSSSFPLTGSSLLMTEVLSELSDRMKSMEWKTVLFDRSVTHSPPASNRPPASRPTDCDPVVPPGCELLRPGSQQDNLNTFTVVPRRRPQSTRLYEFLLTMEHLEPINKDTGKNPEATISEYSKMEKMEMSSKKMVTLGKTDEFESVGETNKELGTAKTLGKLDVSMDDEERLAEERLAEERLAEERLAEERLAEERLAEERLAEEQDETEDQRDGINEYRNRIRSFLSNDDDGKEAKLKTYKKVFDKQMFVPPPPPQLPVCWKAEVTETSNLEETESLGKEQAEEVKAANIFTIQNPNPSRHDPQRDPASDAAAYTPEPCRDVNPSSNHNFDASFTSASQSSPQNHQPDSLQSTSLHVSKSKLEPSCELSSPNSASLFALAVSQKARSLGNAGNPSLPPGRTISSPTLPSQSVSSQHASSHKLYFQSLISQEFISEFPASLGSCNKAPPTSTDPAPPSVVTDYLQLKNLEQE